MSLLSLEFLSGFLLSFSVPHNAIHEQTPVFLFADFFVRVFVTREVYGFLLNSPVEGTMNSTEQRLESFVKMRSKNSNSGPIIHSF